jgi:NADH-quinone oxidoreductase subunit C
MPYPVVEGERLELVRLREAMPDVVLGSKEFRGETYIFIKRDSIVQAVQFLKDSEELAYDYFVECVGADYSRWDHERDLSERFEVVYNLFSTKHSSRLFLKVGVDDGQTVPTLVGVFLGAEYPEREVNDLFGVQFEGNRHEGRFLLPDDWIGYPLRKEYPLGGDDVLFDKGDRGPAIEDIQMPHAGESFEGKTGSSEVSGR